jgi:integrase
VQRRLKDEQLRPSSAYEAERILAKEIVPPWRGRPLKNIERRDVRELLSGVAERGAVISNRVFGTLSKLCNWAIGQDILDKNPTVGVERVAEKSRERWLTDDELRRVWKAASAIDNTYGKIVQFLILSGQRRGEVAGMRWSEVDLDDEKRIWTLPSKRAKNAVLHVVPLTDSMIALIKSMPRIDGNLHVFATSGDSTFQHWDHEKDRLIAAMGNDAFDNWTLHDLRRTLATGLAQHRVDLVVIEKLLNHVSGSLRGVAGIYQRYGFEDEKRKALERWECHVLALIGEGGGTGGNIVNIAETRHAT